MQHKFTVGQLLRLVPSVGSNLRRSAGCTVLALLPFEGHALQYRIRVLEEGYERIVSEANLELDPAA